MRIGFNFHSSDAYLSGVEYYSLGLLRGLLEIDRQNQYLVFTNCPHLIDANVGIWDNLLVRDCRFLKSRLHRILWEHTKLAAMAKEENLDVLHCPHYICPAIRSLVAYVVTIHDTIALDHPNWCKTSNAVYYGRFLSKSARSAVKIVTVSQFTAERIKNHFSLNGSKVKVIHPGIDASIFNLRQDLEASNRVRKKYHLPEKYILFAGNIEPKKNLLILLKAFRLLKGSGLKHHLVITGGRTWKSQDVFDLLHSEFESHEVVLTGYIDRMDMGAVYKMADCVVLPSFCEGFGFPALEAFACGVPVAASQVGILRETNQNAYTNLEPHNPQQMSEAIHRLLGDAQLRELQIQTALKEVQKFRWSDCAAMTLQLYREVCAANG